MSATRIERVSMAVVRERARELEAQRIEDAEELFSAGVNEVTVAARAGFPSVGAAARYFYRKGRPDLARRFNAEYWRRKTQ